MKTIKWIDGIYNSRGIVERSIPDKWMYSILRQAEDRYALLVDTTGRVWDNDDLEFTSLEDAKRWCEAHWMTVGFQE